MRVSMDIVLRAMMIDLCIGKAPIDVARGSCIALNAVKLMNFVFV